MIIFAVYDSASGVYSDPMVSYSSAAMMRGLKQGLQALPNDSPLIAYPADHVLYQIGEYDPRTGVISGFSHDRICSIAELLQEVAR